MPSRSITGITIGLLATSALVAAGPCDIYASGGTPCVAAHSTTRALYANYNGPLYQTLRGSDGATTDISPLSPGGVANAAAQEAFCDRNTCLISIIYDQSGRKNHLTQAPPGGASPGPQPGGDNLASAIGAPVTLKGKKAYGVFISPGTGYRINVAHGTAVGDQAQGMYAVLDGTHYNKACCFDYGNAETNSRDNGNGHMEAIYFGDGYHGGGGTGSGSGPWIMADLENGLFSGEQPHNNPNNPTVDYRFLTAVVKGEPNHWAIRGGNAASGALSTFFDGPRPHSKGYNPMKKEGAIILGIGGDNSDGAQGTFYEGVMTSGYPSNSVEDAVQFDITSAGYAPASLNSGPALNVGSSISLSVTNPASNTQYLAHSRKVVNTQVVSSGSSPALKLAASWIVRPGLSGNCFSFESKDAPGSFLRHRKFVLYVHKNDGSKLFSEDATFCVQAGLNGQGNSIRSWNYPAAYWRRYKAMGKLARNGGVHDFDSADSFNDDVSWIIGASFA